MIESIETACEHDLDGGEECLVAHFIHGRLQPACRRCRKCGVFVRSGEPAPQPTAQELVQSCLGRSSS